MVDGRRLGPLELYELPEAGVGPDTYIWHKGLDDWERAGDDGDICRMMRRRLAGMPYGHPREQAAAKAAESSESAEGVDNRENYPLRMQRHLPPDVDPLPPPGTFNPDTSRRPTPMVLMALLSTLLCFPPTGLVALWFAWKSRHSWDDAWRAEQGFKKEADAESLRSQAHEYARMAKMWAGITLSLGLIFWAFTVCYG